MRRVHERLTGYALSAVTNMNLERADRPVLLVVDDEPIIRELLDAIFRMEGYTVLTAANGDEAIDAGQMHRGEITLCLLDFSLTLRDKRLTAYLNARCAAGVVLMSGYSREAILHRQAPGDQNFEFLQKPFTRDMVVELVSDVLSSHLPAQPTPATLQPSSAARF